MQSGADDTTNEAIAENSNPWPKRRQASIRLFRRGLPFLATVAVVFLGLRLYTLYRPAPEPISTEEVEEIVDGAFAAATPLPAHSASVYQTILPSLVIIKTGGGLPRGDSTARTDSPMRIVPTAFQVGWSSSADGAASFLPINYSGSNSGYDSGDNWTISGEPQPDGGSFGFTVADFTVADSTDIGSGVVINDGGAILTALHIVEYASEIEITFADGTLAGAQIVAVQPDNNIAVLQPDRLPDLFAAATLGNPNALRIGDEAYAVGNPLGLAGSISAGVISGLDRRFKPAGQDEYWDRLIQFDAAVNAGNSGGPLLNRKGEVVGIVVGLINPSAQETFIGIGLAVRIDVAGQAAGAPNQ